jgi:ribulose-phosphate 3-epimerase
VTAGGRARPATARRAAGGRKGRLDLTDGLVRVAPSILACDWSRFPEEVRATERGGADLLHLDVMDGRFVPNLTFGPILVAATRRLTRLFLDVHLMIEEPERWVEEYVRAGADLVTIHVEATKRPAATLEHIRALGAMAGVSIKPRTPVCVIEGLLTLADLVLVMTVEPGFAGQAFMPRPVEKLAELAEMREREGHRFALEVDGGISPKTAPTVIEAGARVLVAGSAYYGAAARAAALREIRGGRG